jgi:hypothetical protein
MILIEPNAEALIRRICDTLQASVLPALANGSAAHQQLKSGLFTLRHVADQLHAIEQGLAADISEMEKLLEVDACASDLSVHRHLQLQSTLAELQIRLEAETTPSSERWDALRAGYLRMLDSSNNLVHSQSD